MHLFRWNSAKRANQLPVAYPKMTGKFEILDNYGVSNTTPKKSPFSAIGAYISRIGHRDGFALIQITPPLEDLAEIRMRASITEFLMNVGMMKSDVKVMHGKKSTGFIFEADNVITSRLKPVIDQALIDLGPPPLPDYSAPDVELGINKADAIEVGLR